MDPAGPVVAESLLLAPLAAGLLILLHGWRRRDAPSAGRVPDVITVAASLGSLVLALVLASAYREPLRFRLLGVHFYLDALAVYFVLLVNVIVLAASWYVRPFLAHRATVAGAGRTTMFYALFNLFHVTMLLVPMVANLVVLWIGIELTTVTSTYLVASDRRPEALEAAWKYIVITSTGIVFALLGTIFLTSALAPGHAPGASLDWPDLLAAARNLPGSAPSLPHLIQLSFLFALLGYGTKAGLAPMHTWLPDGHGEAPYPISALLSGVLLKSALYAILRFYILANAAMPGSVFASRMLLAAGLLSLAVATPCILKNNTFKRVLAYHSLEHMGIITFGLGVGGSVAVFGALLHALNHGITKSLMFLAYGNVQDCYPRAARAGPTPYTGVLRTMPWTGFMLALGGLALVGSPPFNIFFTEFLVLWGAVSQAVDHPTFWIIAAIAVFLLSVVLIFGGLGRHLTGILMGPAPAPESVRPTTLRAAAPLVGLFVLVVLLGLTVLQYGPLDLRRLLDQSVAIVTCGEETCVP
jgi:hydrogenase-4 component F